MIKNYLISAIRNLTRHKIFSIINILGLAGSMAVFILITIYVRLISGTDKFHEDHSRIFRVERPEIHNMAAPVGPFLKNQYPEVDDFVRMWTSPVKSGLFKYDEKSIKFEKVWLADSSFFTVLTFPLKSGNPSDVLSKPDGIVLSESNAKKIFGDENPIGKTLIYNNLFSLQVTGVMYDFPPNSSIVADAIIPFEFNKTIYNDPLIHESFFRWNYNLLVKLKEGVNIEEFEKKVNVDLLELIKRNLELPGDEKIEFLLTPLTEIYFNSYKNYDNFKHGSRSNITIAIGVSIIILLLAVINFTNLSTAQTTFRTKEIGIRKTLGAGKKSLIKQHLTESILTSYISIFIAVLIVEQLVTVFSSMVNIDLSFILLDGFNLTIILAGPILLGILAGSYPAFYISSFSPKTILSGAQTGGQKGSGFRNVLIVTQFIAATVLIIFTLHVNRQVNYLNNRDLGIEKDNKIFIETSPELISKTEAFLNDLKTNPDIITASVHAYPLGTVNEGWGMSYKDINMNYKIQLADSNYVKTLGIKINRGSSFKNHQPTDSVYEVIINQRAVDMYDLKEPIGITINFLQNMKLRIVGVMDDFHYESLHKPIEPLMIVNRFTPHLITISFQQGKTQETIRFIETLWENHSPNSPLTYKILSDDLTKLYVEEARLKRLFQGFTVVAIFIACIGLFGLATFSIGKRTREIGIRKVLGSTSTGVVTFLVWQFLKMIILSMVIAVPISWWLITKWFQNFMTPAGHSIWLYIGSSMLVLVIAMLTVVYHSTKAANTNPASVLKYE